MLRNTISILRVSLVEVFNSSFGNVSGDSLHSSSNCSHSVIFHHVTEDLSVEGPWLTEVTVRMVGFMSGYQSSHLIRFIFSVSVEGEGVGTFIETVGFVVRSTS